jgi:hypothetical protein
MIAPPRQSRAAQTAQTCRAPLRERKKERIVKRKRENSNHEKSTKRIETPIESA